MKKLKQHNPWTDKAAEKIAGAGIRLQGKFALKMNKLFSGLSSNRLKVFLFCFCLGWGGLSVYFVAAAIFREDKSQRSYKVDAIKRPVIIEPTEEALSGPIVDEATYLQIQAFKKGKLYDSTIKVRPGLADSILLLEQIYQSQNK